MQEMGKVVEGGHGERLERLLNDYYISDYYISDIETNWQFT